MSRPIGCYSNWPISDLAYITIANIPANKNNIGLITIQNGRCILADMHVRLNIPPNCILTIVNSLPAIANIPLFEPLAIGYSHLIMHINPIEPHWQWPLDIWI